MMNHKMTKAGKVLFLGSLLMTSVGLSPRHLMLASNEEMQFITLATTTPPKPMRLKVDGKSFEVQATAPTVKEYEEVQTDDKGAVVKTVTKYDHSSEVTFKQMPDDETEACVACIEGTTTVKGTSESNTSDLKVQMVSIKAAITKKMKAGEVAKLANENAQKEEAAKKDYKTCAKIPPAIKKLHDDDNLARAACYLLAADETYRKDGNINSSFHWLELRKQIASAARSKRSEDRTFMSTLESWVNGSRMQLNDDKMVSEIAPSLITEIKDSVVGNKTLATYEDRNETISRQLLALDRQFDRAESDYQRAQEREAEAMKNPRCAYDFSCVYAYHSNTQSALTAVDNVRNGANKYEKMMMKINPRSLSAFEARRSSDGGILAADMDNYFNQFGTTAHRLVDFTQNYSWLNQFEQDQLQNQGRLPYEMVGVRDPNYGLQTPIVGQGVVGNFAGRNIRGGSGGMPTMIAGGGRSNMNTTSAFTSMQAFGGGLNNRPYTGVNLGIPYNYNSGAGQYSPMYQPQSQIPMFQQQQPMGGQRYTFM